MVEFHGPAVVLGKDAQNYLLKHGGIYVRVHPCRLQLVEDKCYIHDSSIESKHVSSEESQLLSGVNNSSETSWDVNNDNSSSNEGEHIQDLSETPVTPPATPVNNLAREIMPSSQAISPIRLERCSIKEFHEDVSSPSSVAPLEMGNLEEEHEHSSVSRGYIPAAVWRLLPHNTSLDRSLQHHSDTQNQASQSESPQSLAPTVIPSVHDEQISPVSHVIRSTKDLLKPQTSIIFRYPAEDSWSKADIVSEAGKSHTKNWHYKNNIYFNLQNWRKDS